MKNHVVAGRSTLPPRQKYWFCTNTFAKHLKQDLG